jgi:4-aminobutyrate aminotransferase-like enzyme
LNPKTSFETLKTGVDALESVLRRAMMVLGRSKTISGDFVAIHGETHGIVGLELAVGFA